jgi:hypothetical protein
MASEAGATSHQTARLAPGRHRSPDEGVCATELASMLAGERFTDRPRTLCPVIGAFLRAYNDAVDDARRQELVPYAAEVVNTRASRDVVRRRAELCGGFIERFETRPPPSRRLRVTLRARSVELGFRAGLAAAANSSERAHSIALAFLETLIQASAQPEPTRARRRLGLRGIGARLWSPPAPQARRRATPPQP